MLTSHSSQNAIRKKNEALNYLRLASRLDAVVSRLDTQAKMQMINKSMVGIVKALDKALQSNNLDRVAATMEQFEKQFENLDVQTGCVEDAMNQQATLSTPEEDVNLLLQQVRSQINFSLLQYGVSDPVPGCNSTLAFSEMLRKHHTFDPQPRTWSDIIRSLFVGQVADEHGLEQQLGLPQAGTQVAAPQAAQAAPESDLTARLAQLRNK